MKQSPSPRAARDGALALIAAGNTLESVSGVFGVPVETLREWVAQPAETLPGDAIRSTEPARPWLHFPGTVAYPFGTNWAFLAGALLVVLPAVAWPWVSSWYPRPVLIGLGFLIAAAFIVAATRVIRGARVSYFELRPDAIARCTSAGCTVLPYADIVGLTAVRGKGYYYIQFLTRTGVLLTFRPTFSQLEDERLLRWLQSVPNRDGPPIRAKWDY